MLLDLAPLNPRNPVSTPGNTAGLLLDYAPLIKKQTPAAAPAGGAGALLPVWRRPLIKHGAVHVRIAVTAAVTGSAQHAVGIDVAIRASHTATAQRVVRAELMPVLVALRSSRSAVQTRTAALNTRLHAAGTIQGRTVARDSEDDEVLRLLT